MRRPRLSLKLQVSLAVFLSILAVAVTSSYFLYRNISRQLVRSTSEELDAFARLLDDRLNLKAKELSLALEVLLADKKIARDFAAGDRETLISYLLPLFESRLMPEYDVTQFHFHLPPATSFLRLHRIAKHSDDLSAWRSMLVEANTGRRPISGIEVTRTGPGLKVVHPVFFAGSHIGSVELATKISQLLSAVATSLRVQYAIGLEAAAWERARCHELLEPAVVSGQTIYYELSDERFTEVLQIGEVSRQIQIVDFGPEKLALTSFPLRDFSGSEIGSVAVAADVTDKFSSFHRELLSVQSLFAALSLIVAALLYLGLRRFLFRPLAKGVDLAAEVAQGNLSSLAGIKARERIDAESADEMDHLLLSLYSMMSYLREMATVATAIADGELVRNISLRSAQDSFGTAFNSMTGNLRRMITDLKDSAGRVAVSATGINAFSDEITQGAETQSSAIEETSAALAEMASQIESISRSMRALAAQVEETSASIQEMNISLAEIARSSGTVEGSTEVTVRTIEGMIDEVRSTADKVEKADLLGKEATHAASEGAARLNRVLVSIETSSRDIAGIVNVIQDFADQTNLLALNAAIEAARAGETGRGFTVIAEEVKRLAERSLESALQVSVLVKAVQENTSQGIEVSEAVLLQTADSVRKLTDLVGEVDVTMQQQTGGSEQILRTANTMRTVTQHMGAALAQQTNQVQEVLRAAAAMELKTQEVADAAAEHRNGALEVARALEQIAIVARQNHGVTGKLSEAATALRDEADRLDVSAAAFVIP